MRVAAWAAVTMLSAGFLLSAASLLSAQQLAADVAADSRHSVDVVFVLDTTGSMRGLINAAKEKIWSIANTLASAKPTPDISMGLVGYRDRGDDYVTRVYPLSDDLDAVYKDLMDYETGGGGDGPESVNQALDEAITKLGWNQNHKTYRVVFLVGDAPPHMDYADDVKFPQTCERAAKAGISINTIQCGGLRSTTPFWTKIAQLAEGRYFRVDQSGSAVLEDTPFDKDLARLSGELDGTRVFFGSEDKRNEAEKKAADAKAVAAKAPEAAQARRAEFRGKSGLKDAAAEADLVKAVIDGKVKTEKLDREKLPEQLRELSQGDLQQHINGLVERRRELQDEIKQLAEKRQQYVKDQLAKQARAGKSLDEAIFQCIKEQGAKAGLKYEGGPSF